MKQKLLWICCITCLQFFCLYSSGWSQNSSITGTVTDADSDEPLPGVNIIIKRTTIGTSTDAQGRFSLDAPSLTDTLVFSFIGYQRKNVPIDGRSKLNVVLTPQTIAGEELVVVGYGTQKSKDVTGSVSSVPLENIEEQPLASPDQALKGQIAGVEVIQSSGIPGGGPQLRVRGPGSITAGSEPLFVVDGFALPNSSDFLNNPLNNIPPENIKSINVLKDASATAIYGSRGANGVVIIETKDGRPGKTQVSVSTYTGIQTVRDKGLPELLNAREFAQFRKEFFEGQVRFEENRAPTPEDVPDVYENPEELGKGTDWLDEITRSGTDAMTNNLNIRVSGGNEDLTASVSGGFLNQKGIALGSDYKRYSLSANLDANVSDRIRMGFRIAPTYSEQRLVAAGGSGRYEQGFGSAIVASPLEPVFNEDGSYNAMISSPGTFPYPNPVQTLKELDNSGSQLRAIGGMYAEFDVFENLTLRSTLNADWNDSKTTAFHPSTVGYLFQAPPVIPVGQYFRDGYLNWQNENTINYTGTLGGGDHSFDLLAGVSMQQNLSNSAGLTGDDFPDDDIKTFNAAARITGLTGETEWALLSYFGRLNYDYKDKYLVTAAVRRDGSSRFGSDNRWGVFPSLALGWRISNEPFMDEISFLNDLKIRASYGINGNFNIGNFAYAGEVGINNYVAGGSLANGKTLNSLRNQNLGWETSKEYNIGLDASFLDSKITFALELYQRTTEDMLLNVELPQSSGFSSVLENRGKIRNRGVEISINSRNVTSNNFSWNTDFNISSNANEVLRLGPDGEPILVGNVNAGAHTSIIRVGEPIGMFYGWQFDGIYESQAEIENEFSYPDAIPGNVKVLDVSGNGRLVRDEDFVILGNPYPDFTFGLTNSLSYKDFSLRVLLTGSYGGKIMRGANEWLWNIDGVFNVTKDYFDNRYISPEQSGDGVTPTPVGTSEARIFYRDPNNLWIHDSSHLWVKNITLGYNLPNDLFGINLTGGQIYVSVQNAFLFSSYNGNPEATNYRNHSGGNPRLTPGVDFNSYPLSREYTIGLRFTY